MGFAPFICAGFCVGLGLAIFSITLQAHTEKLLAARRVYFAAIALSAIVIPILIYWCGMRQFGGFDHSMVIDYGWRLFNGQRPFADFPSTAPISFVLGPYYAFMAFGVRWQSLVIAFAAFSAFTFLWSAWLLAQLFESRWIQIVLAFALQALCTIPVSYWWYNPVTAVSGVIFALSACAWLRHPTRNLLSVSYCVSLLLLATMKPNIAGCLILLITATMLSSRAHRVRTVVLSGAAFATFIIWLDFHKISLADCIRGYLSVGERGLVIGQFFTHASGLEIGLSILGLVLVVAPLAGCLSSGTLRQWRLATIGLATVATGMNSFVSAGEVKVVDLGIVLFGVVILRDAWGRPLLYMIPIAILVSSMGLAIGATRSRVQSVGSKVFFEYAVEREPNSGFFQGLQTGRIFKETYAQVAMVVSQSHGKRMFFGPRMQWGYAAFGLPSPIGQPVWWHPGTSFPEKDQGKYIGAFMAMRNDVLIFVTDDTSADMTYYPTWLVQAIRAKYIEDRALSRLTIFRINY